MLGKILLLAIAVWLLLVLLKQYRRSLDNSPPPQEEAQNMVRCHACGVHLPKSESIQKNGEHYCCEDHSNSVGS